jgi:hypothetical protein
MVDCQRMTDYDCTPFEPAIGALEREAQRQIQLREDLFGDGDNAGAKAATDLALAYRTAAEFLRKRYACTTRAKA